MEWHNGWNINLSLSRSLSLALSLSLSIMFEPVCLFVIINAQYLKAINLPPTPSHPLQLKPNPIQPLECIALS